MSADAMMCDGLRGGGYEDGKAARDVWMGFWVLGAFERNIGVRAKKLGVVSSTSRDHATFLHIRN
jgi:hypothetical protein